MTFCKSGNTWFDSTLRETVSWFCIVFSFTSQCGYIVNSEVTQFVSAVQSIHSCFKMYKIIKSMKKSKIYRRNCSVTFLWAHGVCTAYVTVPCCFMRMILFLSCYVLRLMFQSVSVNLYYRIAYQCICILSMTSLLFQSKVF